MEPPSLQESSSPGATLGGKVGLQGCLPKLCSITAPSPSPLSSLSTWRERASKTILRPYFRTSFQTCACRVDERALMQSLAQTYTRGRAALCSVVFPVSKVSSSKPDTCSKAFDASNLTMYKIKESETKSQLQFLACLVPLHSFVYLSGLQWRVVTRAWKKLAI